MSFKRKTHITPSSSGDRYIDNGYASESGRKRHVLDDQFNLICTAINDRTLSWEERANAISERTKIFTTSALIKGYCSVRFTDTEAKPSLSVHRKFAVTLLGKGFNATDVKRYIFEETGHKYSLKSVQVMCANIRRPKKKKVSEGRLDVWGADFFTGSLRTTAMCRPWSELSAVSARS